MTPFNPTMPETFYIAPNGKGFMACSVQLIGGAKYHRSDTVVPRSHADMLAAALQCPKCESVGIIETVTEGCCGKTDWECKGHCAIPVPHHVQCDQCQATGLIHALTSSDPVSGQGGEA